MNKNIEYTSFPYSDIYMKLFNNSREGAYVSYIRGKRCQTDKDFFYEISASFQFPGYFGENWAALNDCLQDLDWLSFTKIFMVIDDFSLAFRDDREGQNLLLKYLGYMAEYWNGENIDIKILLNN